MLEILEDDTEKQNITNFHNYKTLFEINGGELSNTNNFIYGFSGTGKTGLLKFLSQKVENEFDKIVFLSLKEYSNSNIIFDKIYKKFIYLNGGCYMDFEKNFSEFPKILQKHKFIFVDFPKSSLNIDYTYKNTVLLEEFINLLEKIRKTSNEKFLIVMLNELYLNEYLLKLVCDANKKNFYFNTKFLIKDYKNISFLFNSNFNLWLNIISLAATNNIGFINRILHTFNIHKEEFYYQINNFDKIYKDDNINWTFFYLFISFKYNKVKLYNIKTDNELYFFKYLENDRLKKTRKKWETWTNLIEGTKTESEKIPKTWELIKKSEGKLSNLNSIFKV